MPIFNHTNPNIFEVTFSFPEFTSLVFLKYSQFQSLVTTMATRIFDHAYSNISNQLLIFMNLCQYTKNLAISSN